MNNPFQVRIGELVFEHPLMNGAGYCKDIAHIEQLAVSASSGVVLGSITVKPRTGNAGEVYFTSRSFALNSLGIPNRGAGFYIQEMPHMAERVHAAGKPFIVNIAGFSVEDYGRLALIAKEGGADLLEVNFGCPNIWDQSGEQKRIFSFDSLLLSETLKVIQSIWDGRAISVKLSPYSDPVLLKEVAAIIASFQVVTAVTTTNTFPNAFAYDDNGRPAITVGLAGLSGPVMKAVGLGQVIQFKAALPDSVAIIGVGGVGSGRDMLDYLKAGATAVQVTTALVNEGPNVFSRILSEYTEFFASHELSAIA